MTDLNNQVLGIVAERTGAEPEDLTDEASFLEDLNISELELAELLGELEEELEIEGLLEAKDEIETVGDLSDILADKLY